MAFSSIHQLGKSVDSEMSGQSFQFKVSCSAINECKAHNWISFPCFTTGKHCWYINCCPIKKGKKGEVDYLSFYLWYGGELHDVKVNVDFGVLKKDEASSAIKWKKGTHTFPNCGECFGLEKLVRRDDLKKIMKEDYFTVICNLTILSTVYKGTINSGIIILSSLTGISESRFVKPSPIENKNRTTKGFTDSETIAQNEITSGLFQFKVACSHITENVGRYFDFPIFVLGEHCWLIRCYYGDDNKLSFYVVVRSTTKDLNVSVEFIVKKDEDISSAKWTTSRHTFTKCGECMLMEKFMEGDELKQYLQEDYLRVSCHFTILSEAIAFDHDVTILGSIRQPKSQPVHVPSPPLQSKSKPANVPSPHLQSRSQSGDELFTNFTPKIHFADEPSPNLQPKSQPPDVPSPNLQPKSVLANRPSPNLNDHLFKLLKHKERIDVIFNVNGQIFPAHKLVLAAQSSVFDSELPMDENNENEITINEIEPWIFEAILHFIYTDTLLDLNDSSYGQNEESNQLISIGMFQDLLVAADRYALERLKRICEDKLSKSLTVKTVAITLALADKHDAPDLKARCLEFATSPQNFVKVAVTDGYRHLLLSCPAILKELCGKLNG